MATYGTPASGSPDDPYDRPPVDPTLPQWGPPPTGGTEPPTAPLWRQPPAGGYPPPGDQPAGGGYPPPGGGQPPPYQPPGPYPAAGQPPPPGPYPPVGQPPGPYPPADQPAPAGPWGPPAPAPGYGYGPVPPPTKRSGRRIGLIIALVVVLLLCPCLGLAAWGVWKAADDKGGPSAGPAISTPAAPTSKPSEEPSEEPTTAPTTAEPSPTKSQGQYLTKGDCVVNDGTAADADLRKVPCGPNTYEVLLRIPGTSNGDRCKTLAPKATANYVSDNPLNSLDYVLCLRKRSD